MRNKMSSMKKLVKNITSILCLALTIGILTTTVIVSSESTNSSDANMAYGTCSNKDSDWARH